MENKKPDSHTARKNFLKLAGLVVGVALLIALAYIFHLNGFSETAQAKATSTTQLTFTPTMAVPTPTLDKPTPIPPTAVSTPIQEEPIPEKHKKNL
jgi:hypothetical protein